MGGKLEVGSWKLRNVIVGRESVRGYIGLFGGRWRFGSVGECDRMRSGIGGGNERAIEEVVHQVRSKPVMVMRRWEDGREVM